MKKNFNILSVLMILLMAVYFAGCQKNKSEDGFFYSIEDAFSDAKKNDKNVLLIITSDGDDENSTDFIENVMKSDEFKQQIVNEFTVFHIDFSEKTYLKTVVNDVDDKKAQKAAEDFALMMQENSRFASKLYVQNTPSIFILTKEQYFIAEIDTTEKIENFASLKQLLDEQSDKIKSVNEMVLETKKGSQSEKISAIDRLYEDTDLMYRSLLSDLVFEVIEMDKKNESGLLSKYLLTSADINSSEVFLMGNIDAAVKAYLDICSNEYLLPEHRQQAYYIAAYIMLMSGSDDYDYCFDLLNKSIDAAPETDSAQTIIKMRDYLVNSFMNEE